jgi:hypothetical protein
MIEKASKGDRFNWRLPLYAVLATCLVFVPVMIYGDRGISLLLYTFVVAPIISITVLVFALCKNGRQRLSALAMLAVFCVVSVVLVRNEDEVRTAARWLLWARNYKAELLAQPASAKGELKHIEWDGWGFPGAGDTVVFLVFDPADSLSVAASNHQPGKFDGIPCEVPLVHRLESHWYTVRFYTDEDWGRCH